MGQNRTTLGRGCPHYWSELYSISFPGSTSTTALWSQWELAWWLHRLPWEWHNVGEDPSTHFSQLYCDAWKNASQSERERMANRYVETQWIKSQIYKP